MKTKPVIGINGDYRPSRKDGVALSWFNTGYYDSVTASGGLPLLIPPFGSDDDLKQVLEMCDGIVLAGCSQFDIIDSSSDIDDDEDDLDLSQLDSHKENHILSTAEMPSSFNAEANTFRAYCT